MLLDGVISLSIASICFLVCSVASIKMKKAGGFSSCTASLDRHTIALCNQHTCTSNVHVLIDNIVAVVVIAVGVDSSSSSSCLF